MKKVFIFTFLLFAGLMLNAQEKDPLLVLAGMEKDYAKKESKANKQLIDLISLHQLGHRIGEKSDELAFEAPKGSSTQGVYLRKALLYYSLSAHYAQVAVDDFNSKSMAKQKAKSCEKAAFYYRTLGNPKKVHDKRFIDACDLLKGSGDGKPLEDDTTSTTTTKPGGPEYIDEEFEKTLIGKRLFFKTPKQMFSMMIYEPFVITEEQSTSRSQALSQFEMAIKMMPKEMQNEQRNQMNEKFARGHNYSFGKDLGGLMFMAKDTEGKKVTFVCDDADSEGTLSYSTSVSGARACISNVYKHPISGERLEGGMTLVEVEHKGEHYRLMLVMGEKYNSAKHEKTLKAMARSLRMEGVAELPTVTKRKCKEESVLQLAKGIPVSWTIIDRSRKAVVIQQPKMARDHEIGNAVSKYYGLILAAIKGAKDIAQAVKVYKEVVYDEDLRKALITAGGWKLEHEMKRVDFIPIEIEEFSDFQMDGIFTSAAIFYLDALKGVSSGIGGLGKSMTEKHMKLYWEIPVIRIKGECIPQMVCKDGKWIPDYNNMEYREIENEPGKITSSNKDFLTVRQVERDLDRYFKTEMEKAESAAVDYRNVKSRCVDSRQQLYKIDFPVNIDKCPELENQIQIVQYNILVQEQIQKVRKEELTRWLQVLKPAEKAKFEARLAELKADKAVMNVDLKKKIKLHEGLIANGKTGEAAKVEIQINFLNEDIALIESFEVKTQGELTKVTSGKREKGMSAELSTISNELVQLRKRKEDLKKELAVCVKDYDKVR